MRKTFEERPKGTRARKEVIDKRSDWEIHLDEETKKREKQKLLEEKQQMMKSWIEILYEKMNNKEELIELYLVWSKSFGFKTTSWFEIVEQLIKEGRFKAWISMVTNEYLSCFSDCNKQFRKTRFKRTKIQVEKNPQRIYKENGELTKYGEKQEEIEYAIREFVQKMQLGN